MKRETAIQLLTLGSVAFLLPLTEALRLVDPMARHFWVEAVDAWWYLGMIALLVGITAAYAYKQMNYYFDLHTPGKKAGIIEKAVKQVNPLERTLDFVLGVLGGFLFLSIFAPTVWFLLLSIYSTLVVARCLATLRRHRFRTSLTARGHVVPERYADLIRTEYRNTDRGGGVWPPDVLAGWLLSQALVAIAALVAFVLLFQVAATVPLPQVFPWFLGALLIILALMWGLRDVSDLLGRRIRVACFPEWTPGGP